ncbi:pleiotropic drug resistance protein 1-like [Solanum tuberosum]|uniref:ABCG subfamily transporter protein n=1 Tax=Solanum tuberosum TaxID=4113 RepID=G3FHD6_SOLTU|nr:pleiotropic drug resistance protein 1-like [Solanum tuberosum]AEO22189.1 ABCG subfamily transporter protein [Solanum tuberosum]
MEGGENILRVSSARLSGSNVWRNSAMDVFSRSSSREDYDDEEALRWAALEKLPTYRRIRRGLLLEEEEGQSREVDITKLDLIERRNLLDRLVKIADEDNEKLLMKLKQRIDRVGLDLPTIEVRFEHLNIDAEARVGSRALPTIFNFTVNILEDFLNYLHILPSRKKPLPILHGVGGIIKPGRMTLLLGPPSSGKTTLLLALAGKLDNDLKVSGRVTYNGHGMDEFVPQRTSAYISQNDLHIGEMTVRETLAFSARCQGVGTKYVYYEYAEILAELSRREKEANIKPDPDIDIFMKSAWNEGQEANVITDYTLKILGLEICADTLVGDEMIRGISGGQRKRLTTGLDKQKPWRVTYNGHGMDEFVPQRTSAYISQNDLHIGEMTVRETLAFSARCQGVGTKYVYYEYAEILAELSRREKEANIKPDPDIDIFMKSAWNEGQEANVITDYTLKILGLEICADTLVGDEMIRGISGGQRKRLTTGLDKQKPWEMMVGPARALFMDEISTGLDSSTTYQIVNSIRQSIHILQGTAVISLLQPAPETYDLFDDIILLSDGQIVYQGPRENVLEFFEYLGFKCPQRKGVADFLQEVTSRKDQEQYWSRRDEPYRFITACEFSDVFQSFDVGRKLGDELAVPFDKSKSHPAALTTKRYGISKKELLKACTAREYLLMKRNSFVYIFKMVQLTLMASIAMTLFLRTEMHRDTTIDGAIYLGALFYAVITIMFNGFSELALSIMKLPSFYKQRDFLFFPAWAYALPTWILKIPITLVEIAIWVCMTYYVIGFEADVGRFFKQIFLLICLSQMASGLFRFLAALGRNIIVANTFGSCALLIVLVMGGFILSRGSYCQSDDVKQWLIWGYWISPMMYAQNAIAVNEFLGKSWAHVPPNSTGTDTLGVSFLKSRGIFPEARWYWIGAGALFGYVLLFNFLFTVALAYLNPFSKPQAILSEEIVAERNASKRGEVIELSPIGKSSSDFARSTYGIKAKYAERGNDVPEMKTQGFIEDRLELLKGVSGAFRPGVLTALMGVSGAGKTTLMDVLAGRKTGGYVEGTISISGYPKQQETFARISGYCEQTDIHSPHVTVYESLLYSAWLRLPREVDTETRKSFIEEVMELVELTPLREALVGLPGVNGLSTEQRKRLTVAVELVANPSIIFMDEPTSGLDARAAAIVMRTVRNTVDTGRTVVCTIHQPSIDIFDAFDEGIDGVLKIRDGYNPATWMLEVTSLAQEAVLGIDFTELYKNSELYSHKTNGFEPNFRGKQQDILNAIGSMYAAILFLGIINASSVQPVVAIERTVFYRERAAGMYSALPYAFGQVMIELPHLFLQTIIYGVIVYAMIGFEWTVTKFFWYLFFMYFTLLYFTLYGMMTVAVTPNHTIASIVSSAFYTIWNLFCGFVVPKTVILLLSNCITFIQQHMFKLARPT